MKHDFQRDFRVHRPLNIILLFISDPVEDDKAVNINESQSNGRFV